MLEFGSIISGRQIAGRDWIEVSNPYTRRIVGRVSSVGRAAVLSAIERSRAAKFSLTRHERHAILNRIAVRVESNADAVSRLITDESGLSLKDTRYEVSRVIDVLRFTAIALLHDDSETFPCDVSANGQARRIYTMRCPLNLAAAITPFNHPLNQVVHKVAPAFACNTPIILKPSEKTPLSAYYFAQLAIECGMPADMLNVVNGPTAEVADTLVTHSDVELITFTGSSEIGRRIAARAGYKRMILELGGSSPFIVLEDADVEAAATIAIAGLFQNSGQRCTAIRRLLIQKTIASQFAECLAEKTRKIKYGDPHAADVSMGTVISEAASQEIHSRVQDAVARGAKLLAGGTRDGAIVAPTVLDCVQNSFPLVAQETFGPVAPIIRFETLDEAIRIANDTPYGLSAAIVTTHWPSIQRAITELETGTVNVCAPPSYRLEWSPFGGFKNSGTGCKEGVIEAMKAMSRVKTYSLPWDKP